MPHVTLEHSQNLVEKSTLIPMLQKVHEILVETLPARIEGCKSRVVACDTYLVGDGNPLNAFVHMHVKIKSGRSAEVIDTAGKQLLSLMQESFAPGQQGRYLCLSVEIENLAETYFQRDTGL